jgi:hypothetical protein
MFVAPGSRRVAVRCDRQLDRAHEHREDAARHREDDLNEEDPGDDVTRQDGRRRVYVAQVVERVDVTKVKADAKLFHA